MALLNLQPYIDTLTGTAATQARFTAQAKQAKRPAVRVAGATATFPGILSFEFDGTAWNARPELDPLPVGCYWETALIAGGSQKRRTVILPTAALTVDYADLIDVIPDTAEIDTSLLQWNAVRQVVSDALGQVASLYAQTAAALTTAQSVAGSLSTDTAAQLAAAIAGLNLGTAATHAATDFDAAGAAAAITLAALGGITPSAVDTKIATQHTADVAAFDAAGAAAAITLASLGGITPTAVDAKIAAALAGQTIDGNA